MKKIALIIVMLGVVVGNYSFSQDNTPPPPSKEKKDDRSPVERAEDHTARMTKDLELSAAQSEEIGKINLEHAKDIEALRKEVKALKSQMKSQRAAHKEKVNRVLTAEQRKLHETKMAERRAKHKECRSKCEHKPE